LGIHRKKVNNEVKLFIAYLVFYFGGAALLWGIIVTCFGCGVEIPGHLYAEGGYQQHVVGQKFLFGFLLAGRLFSGFLFGIRIVITLALAAWGIRFVAKNWQIGRDQYRAEEELK
jgi:hypothetical protein